MEISKSTQLTVIHVNYVWTIINYSFLTDKNKEYVESPVFSSPKDPHIKWTIEFHPNGEIPDAIGYLSVFLRLKKYVKGEIRTKFNFHILDRNKKIYATKALNGTFDSKNGAWGWRRLVSREAVRKDAQKVLPNDSLTLKCELSYFSNITATPSPPPSPPPAVTSLNISSVPEVPLCKMSKESDILFGNDKLSDVILVNRGKEFHAHKAILAARSPVFGGMFVKTTGPQLPRVEIPDLENNVVMEMLRFIYTYKVHDIEKLALDLLVAANTYGLDDLKMICAQQLLKSITVKDAPDVLIIADKFKSDYLKNKIRNFMINHATQVLTSTEFKSLNQSHPHLAHWAISTAVNRFQDGNMFSESFGYTTINRP